MALPPMGVTIYGRPQGVPGGSSSLKLVVHHPGGGRVVHRANLWDDGDAVAHHFTTSGDQTDRGALADWVDENQSDLMMIPPEYRPYIGQLIRRGHRYPPEPPVENPQPVQLARAYASAGRAIKYSTAVEDAQEFAPHYHAMGEPGGGMGNRTDAVGILADRAEDSQSPLGPIYRAIFDQRNLRTEYGTHPDQNVGLYLDHGGHTAQWIGPQWGTHESNTQPRSLVQHQFVPTYDGNVLVTLGGTTYQPNSSGRGDFQGYEHWTGGHAKVPPHVAEAALRHLTSHPQVTAHWANPDAPEVAAGGRALTDNPIADLRNAIRAATGHPYTPDVPDVPDIPPPPDLGDGIPDVPDHDIPDVPPYEPPGHPSPFGNHYARLGKAIKYATGPTRTHEDFHNKILENPAETTPALVYADWLEEQGHNEAAEIIRGHVAAHGNGGEIQNRSGGPPGSFSIHGGLMHPTRGGGWGIELEQRTRDGDSSGINWSMPTDEWEGERLARGLMDKGASPYGGSYWQKSFKGYRGVHTKPEDQMNYDQPPAPPAAPPPLDGPAEMNENPDDVAHLRRMGKALRYGATESDVNNLLGQLSQPEQERHRLGHDDPLGGLRGITADAMDEQGRGVEAIALRTPRQRVRIENGRVRREFELNQRRRGSALEWHGGGGSGLYQIGSSGLATGDSARRALEEMDDIRMDRHPENTGLSNPHVRRDFDHLYDYLAEIERNTADEYPDEDEPRPEEDDGTGPGHPNYTGGPNQPGGVDYSRHADGIRRYAFGPHGQEIPDPTGPDEGDSMNVACKRCGHRGTFNDFYPRNSRTQKAACPNCGTQDQGDFLHEGDVDIHDEFGIDTDEPEQYAAWRAPAGGMIARGVYYAGGKMVPDMQGAFMQPPSGATEKTPLKLDHKKVEAARKRWKKRKPKKITVPYDTDPTATGYQRAFRYASYHENPPGWDFAPGGPEEPEDDPPLPPYDDNDRRLWVLNHEPLYRMWQATIGPEVDRNFADPLDDGFIDQHRDQIDAEIREQPGMENYPHQYARTAAGLKRYAEASGDLAALLARARSDPYDPTMHGAIADALDESHPGNKLSQWIRRQYGQGQFGGDGEQNNLWHDPYYAGYDGTHPYAARLGTHGPFNLYLLHEGNVQQGQLQNQRWVLRAESRLRGSRDCAYNFEIPHEQAHEISQTFPEARQYINPDEEASKPPRMIAGFTPTGTGPREMEANHFDRIMDEQERAG